MKLKMICCTLLSISICFLKAQEISKGTVYISGSINSNDLLNIEITKLGLHEDKQKDIVFKMPISHSKQFSGSVNIDKGMYRIGDGYNGHRVFVTPGDSIEIILKKIKQKVNRDGTTVTNPTFHKMHVKAKFPGNYTFFDDIEDFFGFTVKAYKKDLQPSLFKRKCDSAYNLALLLLNKYRSKKIISDTFSHYAKAELDANYIMWICTPLSLIDKRKLPKNYFSKIKDLHFNNYNFLTRTAYYVTAASVYNMYVLNDFDPQAWYTNLDNEFNTASTCLVLK